MAPLLPPAAAASTIRARRTALTCPFTGALHTGGFAIHLAGSGTYQDDFLPTGLPFGSPEEALDCACGLYLNDPSAWAAPPSTN
jgi:hypothetical protein